MTVCVRTQNAGIRKGLFPAERTASLTCHCWGERGEGDSLDSCLCARGPGGGENGALREERVNRLLGLIVILRAEEIHQLTSHSKITHLHSM